MKWILGRNLNPKQRERVLAAYLHRFTGEHRPHWVNRTPTAPNGEPYGPTHATDAEYVDTYAFKFTNKGALAGGHCEPAYLHEEHQNANV